MDYGRPKPKCSGRGNFIQVDMSIGAINDDYLPIVDTAHGTLYVNNCRDSILSCDHGAARSVLTAQETVGLLGSSGGV